MGNELPEIPSILFKRWTVILKTKQLQVSKAITKGSSLFAFKIDPVPRSPVHKHLLSIENMPRSVSFGYRVPGLFQPDRESFFICIKKNLFSCVGVC